MEESGLYTVTIAMVGTMTVTVHAESENEARTTAEACATPLMADEWTCWADEVLCTPGQQTAESEYLIEPGFDSM